MDVVELVIADRDSEIVLELFDEGELYDFAGATRVQIEIVGKGISVDSEAKPGMIVWDEAKGLLRLRLGAAGLPIGKHQEVRVIVFKPEHPNGRPILHEESPVRLVLRVKR